jgi:tyrosyl-tRNA synthetase
MVTIQKQIELIKRGAVEILPSAEGLAEKIKTSIDKREPLVIKAGFDPTAPDIHLGHTVLLRKLRHFQELGHKVIFLIGDYTAMIGDPSGVSKTRRMLTREEVLQNAKTYEKQVSKILDITMDRLVVRAEFGKQQKAQIKFNSEWFSKMTIVDLIDLASKQTIARILERDDFSNRYKRGENISFSEFLYPLFQGYDSVALKADIEIGGTDQKFNMLMGRDIQERYGHKAQLVITMPILVGLDGTQKMSKSLDNYIGIDEPPKDIYGKVMSVSDEMMFKYYELLTDMDLDAAKNKHPMEAKKALALEIVRQYYGEEEATKAQAGFERAFQKQDPFTGMEPVDVDLTTNSPDGLFLKNILFDPQVLNLATMPESKSEFRRLIEQKAITVNGEKITDFQYKLEPDKEYNIKVGKASFIKIIIRLR